ncbi:hypothetical protein BJX68DRAFT_271286 [Aspergillus pseudodeflectus]|uniref:Uncharacterized protein n=1 Tax=Aspergillus pseudodeflectus TaxID=176178 RepID=A0ABR4JMG2_9EURO
MPQFHPFTTFTSLLTLALSLLSSLASAYPAIDSAILCRLLQLDLGLRQAYILLDRLGDDAPSITPADIVNIFNATTAQNTTTLQQPLPIACEGATQFVICLAYHEFTTTSIELYSDLAEDADEFDPTARNGFVDGFTAIYNENADFVEKVAPLALPLCVQSIRQDDMVLEKAFLEAFNALDPATASEGQ